MRIVSAVEAVSQIQSSQRVFLHGGVATPLALVDALVEQAPRLRNVELIHLHVHGPASYADPEFAESSCVANLFVGGQMRKKLREGIEY